MSDCYYCKNYTYADGNEFCRKCDLFTPNCPNFTFDIDETFLKAYDSLRLVSSKEDLVTFCKLASKLCAYKSAESLSRSDYEMSKWFLTQIEHLLK